MDSGKQQRERALNGRALKQHTGAPVADALSQPFRVRTHNPAGLGQPQLGGVFNRSSHAARRISSLRSRTSARSIRRVMSISGAVEAVADSMHSWRQNPLRRAASSTTGSRSDKPHTTFQGLQVLRDSRTRQLGSRTQQLLRRSRRPHMHSPDLRIHRPHLRSRTPPLLWNNRRRLHSRRVYTCVPPRGRRSGCGCRGPTRGHLPSGPEPTCDSSFALRCASSPDDRLLHPLLATDGTLRRRPRECRCCYAESRRIACRIPVLVRAGCDQ